MVGIEQFCRGVTSDPPAIYCECNDLFPLDACDPCLNGATCEDTDYGYTCNCPFGFVGPHCETETCGNVLQCPVCQKCENHECVPDAEASCDLGPFYIDEKCKNGHCNGTLVCPGGYDDCPLCTDPDAEPQCKKCYDGVFIPDTSLVSMFCHFFNP